MTDPDYSKRSRPTACVGTVNTIIYGIKGSDYTVCIFSWRNLSVLEFSLFSGMAILAVVLYHITWISESGADNLWKCGSSTLNNR
jgi:hypothetical protein